MQDSALSAAICGGDYFSPALAVCDECYADQTSRVICDIGAVRRGDILAAILAS